MHYPTRPVDKDKAEQELAVNIKKATSPEESAPKQKHVRSELQSCTLSDLSDLPVECIVYTWDYHSSVSFWSGLKVQPIFVDEVQTFKALITVHKVLQEGHPVVYIMLLERALQEADVRRLCRLSKKRMVRHRGWRLVQGRSGRMVLEVCDIVLDLGVLHDVLQGYGPLIFNGLFEYEEYISLKGIDDPNEGYVVVVDHSKKLY
jgi:hypothetical protein